jgi:hypothetical protein
MECGYHTGYGTIRVLLLKGTENSVYHYLQQKAETGIGV